nr:MAG TPA: hypothetical protein [Caudoviricetes sp.]
MGTVFFVQNIETKIFFILSDTRCPIFCLYTEYLYASPLSLECHILLLIRDYGLIFTFSAI